jgi:putative nucleotidyltransferase with HDIG domain
MNWFDITERKLIERDLKLSYEKLNKTLESVIETLATMVETRDPYTSGHQKRVAALAVAIAGELGLSDETIETIRLAATIHDIGKINIPASILTKPGRLTDIEFSLIKTHARTGYDLIKNIEFQMPIAKIILQHHEKMDGSGYPQGLKGEDIMLEARIITVADVVEAMSSDRPYRPALGIEVALGEIKKNRGKLFDANAVDACVKLFTKKGFKLN